MADAPTPKFTNRTMLTDDTADVVRDLPFAACCWFFVLLAVPVARFWPGFLMRRFVNPGTRGPIAPARPLPSLARPVSSRFLVSLTTWFTPWPARWCVCLPQAVAVALALRVRWRLRPIIQLGAYYGAGRLRLHAWAELDGRPFTETSDMWSTFRPVTQ